MINETIISDFVKAHATPPKGMVFYNSFDTVRRDTKMIGFISVIQRAWEEMKLDGVLSLDGRPILYLKEYKRPVTFAERLLMQRRFWNQGVANVLLLADTAHVYIYSGLAKPQKSLTAEEKESALIQTVTHADYVQRIQSFYHGLATGHYYEEKKQYFNPDESMDSWLLDNLRALRDALTEGSEGLEIKHAHAFIGRVLFLCYLLDREIISVDKTHARNTGTMELADRLDALSSHKARITFLYDELFSNLKERFNGNMFDQDLNIEKRLIRAAHLEKLIEFLGGHDVASGRRTLGFWAYDFKMIPVETISAIYQDFLAAEDKENQQKRGAFYTPRFLSEMVVDVAMRATPEAVNWSFLDPSCGSGIFLVILFNRLANNWLFNQTGRILYTTKAKALQEILARQIRGVDIEETACRIASFSLYLAYLDFFDPPDIQSHIEKTGKPLPKLLNYGDTPDRPSADIPVIHRADFLSDETLACESFDCIIGNPPWAGRGSKQLALKFIQKAPQLLMRNGNACLLLPSKILQNQSDAFQTDWLKKVTLEKVLQLADYSFLLFRNALCPAIIVRFRNEPPDINNHRIEFAAPKFTRDGLRQGIITINPSAQAWIPLADILTATQTKTAPVVWKRHLWGTPRDQKLLELLQSMPSLQEHVDVLSELRKQRENKSKKWIIGQGIKPWKESTPESESDRLLKPITSPPDMRFIETSSWDANMLLLLDDTILLKDRLRKKRYRSDVLYSQPPQELFRHPMVLVSQGFGKVAYCDFDVLFQHSLQSIAGPPEDSDLLMFLTAYLQSGLARYFLFHTSANWGSERDKVHLDELLRVPFPLPGNEFISPDAQHIVDLVAGKLREAKKALLGVWELLNKISESASLFGGVKVAKNKEWTRERKKLTDALQQEIEPLIYRYFGLTEQEIMLVEDTIRIFEPSSTPTTWRTPLTITLDSTNNTKVEPYVGLGLKAYADTLTATLNKWAQAEGSTYRVSSEGGTDEQTGLGMLTINLTNSEAAYQQKDISRRLADVLKLSYKHSARKQGALVYERDIMFFQNDHIHIVRPDILLNWTRTAALNDAARIYGEIALSDKEDNGA